MCTVYAVEALQTLALAGADARQHLEISATEWGPLVWRLGLAEPEEWPLYPGSTQVAYWVCIFGNNLRGALSGLNAQLHRNRVFDIFRN